MSIKKILSNYIDEINLINIIIDYKDSHLNYLKKLYLQMRNFDNHIYIRKYIDFLREEEDIDFLIRNEKYVNWYLFIQNYKITRENFNIIYDIFHKQETAYYIFSFHQIPIDLIESKINYYTHREWYYIGLCQKLTEDFINKYVNKLHIYCLNNNRCLHQTS